MLILLWVRDEKSFDRFHTRVDRIYRVNAHIGTGVSKQVWGTTQAPVATYALKEIPGVMNAVRILPDGDYKVFSYKGKDFKAARAAYADASLFSVLDFPLLEGDPSKPLPNDKSVVLTRSEARKYFGDEDPLGKTLVADHTDPYTVSGVVADFPENSSIQYDMIFPMALVAQWYDGKGFWKTMDDDWGNFGFTTFLEVQPGTSLKAIGEKLIRIQLAHAPRIMVSVKDNPFELQPLKDIHLYQPDGTGSGMQTVRIFFLVAVFILLIACINYVNLSTARATLRAREVSIRKIIGARKKQLFAQFFAETVLFFALSVMGAFLLMALLMPYYNDLSGKHLSFSLTDAGLWEMMAVTVAGTLLASAVYSALLLSSFEPLKAIKGRLSLGIKDAAFRKILVTSQFVFSVVLIIGTLVIARQLAYLREKDPGYDRSQIFTFNAGNMERHLASAKGMLRNEAGILEVASANNKLVDNENSTGGVDWDGKDPRSGFIIRPMGVDEDFIPTMKIKLVAGHNFTGSDMDSAHFLLNETAVRLMGIKDPVGKRLKYQQTEGTIIGVLKDYNYTSLKDKIDPAVLYFKPQGNLVYVRTTGRDAAKAIAAARRVWTSYNAGFPFEYTFLDDDYAHLYKSEQRTGVLFNIFSIIAIIISCMGLLGLATYSAQVRTKEIGIRKVLGASVSGIVSLVSAGFLKLVGIAILVAAPIAWWCMHTWLQDFAYRVDIGWTVFLVAGASAFGVAFLAIGFQSVQAALASPVKSLRSE